MLTAGVEIDAELQVDLEFARQQRMETLKAGLTRMIAEKDPASVVDQVMSFVPGHGSSCRLARLPPAARQRFRFGRRTEKLSKSELQQLFLAFGGDPRLSKALGEEGQRS